MKKIFQSFFERNDDTLKSYEENLKWESALVSEALHDTRKRKFFAINFSIILFPGLIGGILAIVSYLDNTGMDDEYKVVYYWIAIVAISMFIGMANMITIKYIAAYKAQANLFIRQLNCLRQARDFVTYNRFEGKFPNNIHSLLDKEKLYYQIFGKHRKLYIGNEELRGRLVGSFSESADKSLIGFLFITSLTLISAPFICLAAISLAEWDSLKNIHFHFLDSKIFLIFLNILFIVASVILLMFGHWRNFTKLRTGDAITDRDEDHMTGSKRSKVKITADYVSVIVLIALSFYWIYPPLNMGMNESFKYLMGSIFLLILFSFLYNWKGKKNKVEQNNLEQKYMPLFEIKRTDYVSMLLVTLLAVYWFYLGWNTGISIFKTVILFLSILSLFLILVCVNKVFFDSLNRIHKSLVYKIQFSLFKTPRE